MRAALTTLAAAAALAAIGVEERASAKGPKNIYVLRVSAPGRVEEAQVRYLLTGKFGAVEGWQADAEEGEIVIRTERGGSGARSIKGVAFVPGCHFDFFEAGDLTGNAREVPLPCNAARVHRLQGRFARPAPWRSLQVNVEVRYLAPWVRRHLNSEGSVPDFLLATVPVDANGAFTAPMPELGGAATDGEFYFIARESTSGDILAVLAPAAGTALRPGAPLPSEAEFRLMAPK